MNENIDLGITGKEENSLFGDLDKFCEWSSEWQGMPEYDQKDAKPYQQIILSFEKREDVIEFSKLIDQKITDKTKSLWFPKLKIEKPSAFIYTDES